MGRDALPWSWGGRLAILNLGTFRRTFAITSSEMTNSSLLDMGGGNWFSVAPGDDSTCMAGDDACMEGGDGTVEGDAIVGDSDDDAGTGCVNAPILGLDDVTGRLNSI